MAKERNIKIIYLAIIIILVILLYFGYFRRYAYASETSLNEVYTIEEIYNMYNIPEERRVNPKDYGYKRILGVVDTTFEGRLCFICYNQPFDFSNTYLVAEDVKYRFNEKVRLIEYELKYKTLLSNDEYTELDFFIAEEPLNETTYNENYYGRRIIYSSHDIYKDGALFFSARKMKTKMAPIMANLNLNPVMKEVVSLIPIGAGLVVSFLALRKGLKLLLRMLRQA